MRGRVQQWLSVAVESLRQSWRSGSYGAETDAGRPGHNGCRVSELILNMDVQNLSRGTGTIEALAV